MPDTRLALTDRSIGGLPFAVSSQYFARDTELAGFAVLVGKRRKTFVVQGDIRKGKQRLSIRIKVGAVGEKTTREARAEAKEFLGKIAKGIDPREKDPQLHVAEQQPGGVSTLRQAWQRYQEAHVARKGLSGTTIKNYRDHVERLMADWLDQPLSVLGLEPNLVASRHDKITREQGPYLANGCMRTLRAIYNHARKTARQLPAENPVSLRRSGGRALLWRPGLPNPQRLLSPPPCPRTMTITSCPSARTPISTCISCMALR